MSATVAKPPRRSRLSADPHLAAAQTYARDVIRGRLVACQWARLACERQERDLAAARAGTFPYIFDPVSATRICRFAELLPHVKGKWARRDPANPTAHRIRLEPWQCFILTTLFGWRDRATGHRRFKEADIYVPRKNAKSTLSAAIGWWMFAKDNEPGAEVYCGATTKDQAMEVFSIAKQFALAEPALPAQLGVEVNAMSLMRQTGGNLSKFAPIIGKPGDGASPHCAIIDEFHEHATSEQLDTLKTGMGAREQPLLLVISTAGFNLAGPCRDRWRESEQILARTITDERRFAIIYTIDNADEWTTETGLKKANPNWSVSVNPENVLADQQGALREARNQTAFKTKHCNLWVSASAAYFNLEAWQRCHAPTLRITDYPAARAIIAGDLASKVDLVALAIVLPLPEGRFATFARYYAPAATVELPHHQHYQKWAREGWLTVIPGDMIDLELIRDDLLALCATLSVDEIPLDPWQALMLINQLRAAGANAYEFRQTVQLISEPMKHLDALMRARRLLHDGNPITAWCLSNVVAREDAKGNVYPRKERDAEKIDGAVALIMALARAMHEPTPTARPGFAFV
jgi:phage terminase large subunit-like protein